MRNQEADRKTGRDEGRINYKGWNRGRINERARETSISRYDPKKMTELKATRNQCVRYELASLHRDVMCLVVHLYGT